MSDRTRSKSIAREVLYQTISRRQILEIGGAIIPAGIMLPAWLTATAQTTSSFDFYISPTGSDSSPGTVTQPWAITSLMSSAQNANNVGNWNKTSGKRVGLLAGTYNVSSYMKPNSWQGALQINGGTSGAQTYIGSSDSSGHYSRGAATLTALSAGGVNGGVAGLTYNGPIMANTGSSTSGYFTIDGLVFSGFSYKCVRFGGGSSGNGPSNVPGVIFQNNEIHGGSPNPGDATDNGTAVWVDGTIGAIIQNNYIHNNAGPDAEHTDAIQLWGDSSGSGTNQCSGTIIQYNTVVQAGAVFGKESNIQGTTVRYNYIDGSMYTSLAGMYGIQDFTGATTSGLTQPSYFYNNIVLTSAFGLFLVASLTYSKGWTTPVYVYNNTIVITKIGKPYPAAWLYSQTPKVVNFYNNIYTGAADASGYGAFRTNPNGPAIWDYNLFKATGMTWALVQDANGANPIGAYTTLAAMQVAIIAGGGTTTFDAHSIANDNPQFTGTGPLAAAYQLQNGSPAKGAGRTTGTPAGSPCDMGAWGNGATQIGCSFASGAPVPMAPTLSVS
jgi:hypothetical protein